MFPVLFTRYAVPAAVTIAYRASSTAVAVWNLLPAATPPVMVSQATHAVPPVSLAAPVMPVPVPAPVPAPLALPPQVPPAVKQKLLAMPRSVAPQPQHQTIQSLVDFYSDYNQTNWVPPVSKEFDRYDKAKLNRYYFDC